MGLTYLIEPSRPTRGLSDRPFLSLLLSPCFVLCFNGRGSGVKIETEDFESKCTINIRMGAYESTALLERTAFLKLMCVCVCVCV